MSIQPSDSILIVDFGSQVTQLIARRVREAGVYSEIAPFNTAEEAFKRMKPKGDHPLGLARVGTRRRQPARTTKPVRQRPADLGHLLWPAGDERTSLAARSPGHETGEGGEFGRAFLTVTEPCVLFDGLWQVGERHQVWMSHGDKVTRFADGFRIVATSDGAPFAVIADDARRYYGTQFHPEVVHTPDGAKLIANFVHKVCGLSGDWTMAEFRATKIAEIREQVGSGRVICGLSGGVDSSVAAILIHEAIGEQLTCVFVDHGLLRLNEREQVESLFRDHYNIPLVVVDAEERFMAGLAGVTDPEKKRKFIGAEFINVFEEEAKKLGGADFLAQGTLYPDVIESVSFTGGPSRDDQEPPQCRRPARTHEHATGRAVARTLQGRSARAGPRTGPQRPICRPPSLPRPRPRDPHPRRSHQGTLRHPAQGRRGLSGGNPQRAGLYDAIWQAFAVLLPVRTVGVMGDFRTYDSVCALRAVNSTDGMTADIYPFDAAFLSRVATRIINEVQGINRVVYDYTSKPPGTIEWE
jgi:GMP synthase (glutamine-hydrolysing)